MGGKQVYAMCHLLKEEVKYPNTDCYKCCTAAKSLYLRHHCVVVLYEHRDYPYTGNENYLCKILSM